MVYEPKHLPYVLLSVFVPSLLLAAGLAIRADSAAHGVRCPQCGRHVQTAAFNAEAAAAPVTPARPSGARPPPGTPSR